MTRRRPIDWGSEIGNRGWAVGDQEPGTRDQDTRSGIPSELPSPHNDRVVVCFLEASYCVKEHGQDVARRSQKTPIIGWQRSRLPVRAETSNVESTLTVIEQNLSDCTYGFLSLITTQFRYYHRTCQYDLICDRILRKADWQILNSNPCFLVSSSSHVYRRLHMIGWLGAP